MPKLGEIVALLDDWYPPATADSWDAVGLVAGDPDQPVRRVHLAVDPTLEVAREAVAAKADLLVVHHPLFLKAVHGVAATTPKGRTLAALTGGHCALLTAHTNADQAVGGVSEALATALANTREGWERETTANNLRLFREARERRGDDVPWAAQVEQELLAQQ